MQNRTTTQNEAESPEQYTELLRLRKENENLEKINAALMYRLEEGSVLNSSYRAFENSVQLFEKVNQQTKQLNRVLQELESKNFELAKAHEETKKIEERLNDAIESIDQPMVLVDVHGKLIFFNSQFETIWDNTKFVPKIGDNYQDIINNAMQIGMIQRARPSPKNDYMVYKFFDDRWHQITIRKTKEQGSVVLFNDVTEVKLTESNKYERVIRRKNQILQSLINNIDVAILRVKWNDEIEFWNNTFLQYAGLSSIEIASYRTLSELINSKTLNGLDFSEKGSDIQNVGESSIVQRKTTTLTHGSTLYTFTDVTSQYVYAETLKENERWIRLISDNVPALIAYIGPERNFLYTNKAYRDWYGLTEESFKDTPLEQSHLKDVYPRISSYLDRVNKGEVVSFSSEEKNADNQLGFLHKVYLPHFDGYGNIIGHFVLATDTTEQVKTQKALEKAKNELESRVKERTSELKETNHALQDAIENKSRYLAAISHDLLQPLSAAMLFNESLKVQLEQIDETSEKNQKNQKTIEAMANSLADLNSLIRTLIEISKLDAGLIQASIETIDIGPLLHQLSTECEQISKNYNVNFKKAFHYAYVKTDSALLSRVLRNFLINALKYGANHKILFAARKVNSALRIMVFDQGLGLTNNEQSEIFMEFKRLDNEFKYRDSLGLGLSIVDKISKLLKHPIGVTSKKGSGSCFYIDVPLANESRLPLDSKKASNEESNTSEIQNLNVWHIDNDLNIRIAMQVMFDAWGINLETFPSFERCCAALNGDFTDCHVMMLDYHLDDGQTGMDVAGLLKEEYPDLPIILLTANQSKSLISQAENLNISVFHKPVDPKLLSSTLAKISSNRQIKLV